MNVTPSQLDRLGQLSDQWSFLWDKRRSLWIAAEDCPDGEQMEEADLDALLARLTVIAEAHGYAPPVMNPAAGDFAFALPAPQRGAGPVEPAVGELTLARDGVAGAGAAEAVGFVVAEVAGGGDDHDDCLLSRPAVVVRGVGAVPPGEIII